MAQSKKKLLAELARRKNLEAGIRTLRDKAPHPRPLADIEADLQDLEDREGSPTKEATSIEAKGRVQEAIQAWAESEGFEFGESVSGKKIAKFVRDNIVEHPSISDGYIRSVLSRLGYSKEKNPET